MKKILLLLFLGISLYPKAQTSLLKLSSKSATLPKNDVMTYAYDPKECFDYNEKTYSLISNMNLKVNVADFIPYIYLFKKEKKYATEEDEIVRSNLYLLEMDHKVNGSKGSKMKKINLPKNLSLTTFKYIGMLQNENILNIFLETNVSKKRKKYVLNCIYDITTQKLDCKVVFKSKNMSETLFSGIDKKNNTATLVYGGESKDRLDFSYIILNNKGEKTTSIENQSISMPKGSMIESILITSTSDLLICTKKSLGGFLNNSKEALVNVYMNGPNGNKEIFFEQSKKYLCPPTFFNSPDGKLKFAYLQSSERRTYEDLAIGEIQIQTGKVINYKTYNYNDLDLYLSKERKRAMEKKERKDKRKGKESEDVLPYKFIADIKYSPDGFLYILLEEYSITTTTTMTSNGNGSTTTTTRTTESMGPGNILVFDSDYKYDHTSKLKYLITNSRRTSSSTSGGTTSGISINPGSVLQLRRVGFKFVALNNQKVLFEDVDKFTQYDVSSSSLKNISQKSDKSKNLKKVFTATGYKAIMNGDKTLSLIKMSNRSKFTYTNYKL